MPRDLANFRVDRSLTRIVATVGPASSSPAMLTKLLRAGVSVFRLNMSHGDPDTHARTVTAIHAIELPHHDVTLVDDHQRIRRQIVNQRWRRLTRLAAG
jgi:pyruvate kinase